MLGVRLRNDGNAALGSPSEKDLCWGLSVLLSDGGNSVMFEKGWGVIGLLPLELNE